MPSSNAIAHTMFEATITSGPERSSAVTSTVLIGHDHGPNLQKAQPKLGRLSPGLINRDGELDFDLGFEVFLGSL